MFGTQGNDLFQPGDFVQFVLYAMTMSAIGRISALHKVALPPHVHAISAANMATDASMFFQDVLGPDKPSLAEVVKAYAFKRASASLEVQFDLEASTWVART